MSNCGASVILLICVNISLFECVGSSNTSKSWKSQYDPVGVGATGKPINIQINRMTSQLIDRSKSYILSMIEAKVGS